MQSKILEQKGFVHCSETGERGGIKISLTDKIRKELLDLLPSREKVNDFIFAQFAPQDLARQNGGFA